MSLFLLTIFQTSDEILLISNNCSSFICSHLFPPCSHRSGNEFCQCLCGFAGLFPLFPQKIDVSRARKKIKYFLFQVFLFFFIIYKGLCFLVGTVGTVGTRFRIYPQVVLELEKIHQYYLYFLTIHFQIHLL